MRLKTITLLCSTLVASACSSQIDYRETKAPPPTVASVDLEKYSGKWFEIARYPNSFQQNCEAVTAEYAMRDDGKITVTNTCHAGDARSAEGVARIVPNTGNAQLKVKFAPEWVPFASGDYWILHLEDDYSAALVGDPDGKYLWILARMPVIEDALLDKIKARAEEIGYATAPLKMTQHQSIMQNGAPKSLREE